MRKIRIGNDIRIQTALTELDSFDQNMIKQLKCYFIKTEEVEYVDLNNPGYPQYYSPTEYDICSCGIPQYNWLPYNGYVFNSGMFGPIDDYRIFPTYNGFGVNSKQFKITQKEYLAPSRVLASGNKIECYFPAQDQKNIGIYKLVIVVTCYQHGWGSNNLRTYTLDKGNIIQLVDDNSGENGNINIDTTLNDVIDIIVPTDQITLRAGERLKLGERDCIGNIFYINVQKSDRTAEELSNKYNPTCVIRNVTYGIQDLAFVDNQELVSSANGSANYEMDITVNNITKTIRIRVEGDKSVTFSTPYVGQRNLSNNNMLVKYNKQYILGITAISQPFGTITVKMGNVDITAQSLTDTGTNRKTVFIPHVVDNITITEA